MPVLIVPLAILGGQFLGRLFSSFRLTPRELKWILWLYLAAGIPTFLLFVLHGWTPSFDNGEAFLFVSALLIGAMAERCLEGVGSDGRRIVLGYLVVTIIGAVALLGLSLFYVVSSRTTYAGPVDRFEVAWFFIAIVWAAAVRNAGHVSERAPLAAFKTKVAEIQSTATSQPQAPLKAEPEAPPVPPT
jgi:hypothetical protein